MSRIWLEKLNTPFRLVVFDNHTDMSAAGIWRIAFLCEDGWRRPLRNFPLLKEVLLVKGPDQEAFEAGRNRVLREKVRFLSREKLGRDDAGGEKSRFLRS